MDKPDVFQTTLPGGARLVRFNSIFDIFYYDDRSNNPNGLGQRNYSENYMKNRLIMTPEKEEIYRKVRKNLSMDKEFLELIYKGKSDKRKFTLNKFVGNLDMPNYASHSEKIFKRSVPGAKKVTLDMAFQVGTFIGQDYSESFIQILKTVLMCQSLGIALNIDLFDSDTGAIADDSSYVIVNIANSKEKFNVLRFLAASHEKFFTQTLFNGYSAHDAGTYKIRRFLPESRIIKDLGTKYDVIGGNSLVTSDSLVSKVIKIGLNGIRY